jgi:glycosyltransferase involved in cell wall biosynthesis
MKILLVHNRYKLAGGEDVVFNNEEALLRAHNEDVITHTVSNEEIDEMGKLRAARNTLWSSDSYRAVSALIQREKPDVVHFHNWFMRLSPSVLYAAHDQGVPVVQTLHNYRLICPKAVFYRDGHVCEDCMGKVFKYPAILHGCYRDSRATSAVVAAMLGFHQVRGTWHKAVDRFIALTEFGRHKFIEAGLPADKVIVKPNYIQTDPGVGQRKGGYAIFIGRMTEEKGVMRLVEAWRELGDLIPLRIYGEGPLEADLRAYIEQHGLRNVQIVGQRPRDEVIAALKDAYMLIMPSEWYEGAPMTLLEAMVCGIPMIAGRLGAAKIALQDGVQGLHFTPGDGQDLALKVRKLVGDPAMAERFAAAARTEYEIHYSAARNYEILIQIYEAVRRKTSA